MKITEEKAIPSQSIASADLQKIIIAEGSIQIDGVDCEAKGIAYISLGASNNIFIETRLENSTSFSLMNASMQHKIVIDEIIFPLCSLRKSNLGNSIDGKNDILFSCLRTTQLDIDTREINLSGLNAPRWIGKPVNDPNGCVNFSRLNVNFNGYVVDLESIGETDDEKRKDLTQSVTVAGRIYKSDNAVFSTDEKDVKRIMSALGWAMTFAAGHWVMMPIALNASGADGTLWKTHTIYRGSRYNWGKTWHSPTNSQALIDVINGLLIQLENDCWERPLKEAINWYTDSISADGTSVGHLIWAQTGLELMAWTYLTQDPSTQKLTEENFDGKSAALKISALLKEVKVPLPIPARYAALSQFATDLETARTNGTIRIPASDPFDGPSIITHVRNIYVHPKQGSKRAILPNEAHFEAHQLALEYLELSILKVLNVDSPIVMRSSGMGTKSVADVSPPPWVTTTLN